MLCIGLLLRMTGKHRLLKTDPRVGGRFKTTMAAKNKSMRLDYGCLHQRKRNVLFEYNMDDGWHVKVAFT
jgi:hypothetical protein